MKHNLPYYILVSALALLPWTVSADTSLSTFVQQTGQSAEDIAGSAIATGDINNDGYEDLIIGAPADGNSASGGSVYLIYGRSTALSDASLSTRIEFTGESVGDNAGSAVAIGDINNDGYDDILIGAYNYSSGTGAAAGATYLIYGQASQLISGSLSTRIIFYGETAGDRAGYAVSTGDINYDSYDDILISAYGNDDGGSSAGAVYLIYGQASGLTPSVLSDPGIVEYTGEAAGDRAGSAIAAGDVNNDGYDDILVGANNNDDADSNAGATYLLYGQSGTLSSVSLGTAVEFTGEASGHRAGTAVATGDINNDGYDDILIGAEDNNDGGSEAGAAYLIYGRSTTLPSSSLSTRAEFTGEAADDNAGESVSTGDFNNDGYDDILIGAEANDDGASNAGSVYLVPGRSANWASTALSVFTEFTGEAAGDRAGSAVTTGNINGDDFSELIIGAYSNNDGGSNAGTAYIGYLYIDGDGDGVAGTTGLLATGTDCNDEDSTVSANQTYYLDGDGDGLGGISFSTTTCLATAPTDYVANSSDRNDYDFDNDGTITPDDCDDTDSVIATTQTYYQDSDSDGLGNAAVTTSTCSFTPPAGYVINASDTNDLVASGDSDNDDDGMNADTDCNDADATVTSYQTYYLDGDDDGLGGISISTTICSATAPANYVTNSDDRNDYDYDNDDTITPSDCNDADSTIADNQTYYQDSDGDGLGNATATTSVCSLTPPDGYVINSVDTDDAVASGDSDNDDDGVDVTTDCNDADSTVSDYQTYYQDSDGDGYGNASVSTSVCSVTAPTGYVTNSDDADDADGNIIATGIEIGNDGIDNDGDTEVDEVNTLAENGAHPVYSDDDVTDETVYTTDITAVAGTRNGDILVTYADDSVYRYDIFTLSTTKNTLVTMKPNSSLAVVVQPIAKKIALVNALSGEVLSTKSINSKTHSKVKLLVKDLRTDGKYEAVVVAKRGSKTVHVDLVSIKVASLKLKLRDATTVKNNKIVPSNTRAKNNSVKLRQHNGRVVINYSVNKKYHLVD